MFEFFNFDVVVFENFTSKPRRSFERARAAWGDCLVYSVSALLDLICQGPSRDRSRLGTKSDNRVGLPLPSEQIGTRSLERVEYR
jgi:hypothetical protein